MTDLSDDGSNPEHWFAGDRRLFYLAGPLAAGPAHNPDSLVVGCSVQLPRSVRSALKIDNSLSFTLAEVKAYGFGSMGFCEVDGQPGRGAWIRLRRLVRCEGHTPLGWMRPARRRKP